MIVDREASRTTSTRVRGRDGAQQACGLARGRTWSVCLASSRAAFQNLTTVVAVVVFVVVVVVVARTTYTRHKRVVVFEKQVWKGYLISLHTAVDLLLLLLFFLLSYVVPGSKWWWLIESGLLVWWCGQSFLAPPCLMVNILVSNIFSLFILWDTLWTLLLVFAQLVRRLFVELPIIMDGCHYDIAVVPVGRAAAGQQQQQQARSAVPVVI